MTEWFETFPAEFWLPGGLSTADEAEFLRRALRLRPGHRVLDCPSGDGRIALPLARAGCDVTCVDLSAPFIARARRRFARAGLPGAFRVLDMRRLNEHNRYHAAINWHGSFGYFGDAENADVLRRLAASLRPGGRLVIDQPHREALLRNFRRIEHGAITIRSRWDGRTQRVRSRWQSPGGARASMSIRLYTPRQMRVLLAGAGMEIENVFGDRLGQPFGRSTRRMVIIARKVTR